MHIACTKPYLVLTNPGYVRLSLEDYKPEFSLETKEGRARHLTNAAVQKHHPNYKKERESSILAVDDLKEYLMANGHSASTVTGAFTKMDEICRLLFAQVQDKLDRKYGCFELFGLDFMLDDLLNPVLIEVNTNPALFTDTAVQKNILPRLVDDVVKMALNLHQPGKLDADKEV